MLTHDGKTKARGNREKKTSEVLTYFACVNNSSVESNRTYQKVTILNYFDMNLILYSTHRGIFPFKTDTTMYFKCMSCMPF